MADFEASLFDDTPIAAAKTVTYFILSVDIESLKQCLSLSSDTHNMLSSWRGSGYGIVSEASGTSSVFYGSFGAHNGAT